MASFYDIAGSTCAALVLWTVPAMSGMDARVNVVTTALALGASAHAVHQSEVLNQELKHRKLKRLITDQLATDWTDLEYDQRLMLLKQRYGLVEVQRAEPEVLPPAEPEWQPVNPFMMSATAARLMMALEEFGVKAEHIGQIEGPRIIRHQLKPGKGVSTKKIKALADDLKVALTLPVAPIISEQAGYVAVDIPGERKLINFGDYIQKETRPNDSPVMLALGVNLMGELVEGNISDPDYCHGLGAGKTGSGKTELIIAMTKSLTDRYSSDLVKYVIHTMKAQDFRDPFFQGNPWMWRQTCRHPLEALQLVKDLVIEMRGRNEFLADNSSKNIDEHNRKFPDAPMHHIVFHFDECGGTMLGLKQIDRDNADEKDAKGKSMKTSYFAEMTDGLKALAKEARAAGIHLFCWDQKPSEKALDTDIRSELGLRVCLKVQDDEASKMVINSPDADQLLGKGDMLALIDGKRERLQGLFVTPDLLTADPSWTTPAGVRVETKPAAQASSSGNGNPGAMPWGDAVQLMKQWVKALKRTPTDEDLKSEICRLTGIHPSELTGSSITWLRKDLGL